MGVLRQPRHDAQVVCCSVPHSYTNVADAACYAAYTHSHTYTHTYAHAHIHTQGARENATTYMALIPVVVGVIIASGGEPNFHVLGFTLAMLAVAGNKTCAHTCTCTL